MATRLALSCALKGSSGPIRSSGDHSFHDDPTARFAVVCGARRQSLGQLWVLQRSFGKLHFEDWNFIHRHLKTYKYKSVMKIVCAYLKS